LQSFSTKSTLTGRSLRLATSQSRDRKRTIQVVQPGGNDLRLKGRALVVLADILRRGGKPNVSIQPVDNPIGTPTLMWIYGVDDWTAFPASSDLSVGIGMFVYIVSSWRLERSRTGPADT
jgi:hypothetical protein